MRPAVTPLPIRLYGAAANLIVPIAYRRICRNLQAHGADPARLPERMGHATVARPEGTLIWFHAASIGESRSVMRLISRMGAMHPGWSFLMTTGTASSAEMVARHLPARCIHQFAPLDAKAALRRFLVHWHPSAAIFVESELWPQMLGKAHAAGIPLALINARISENSARRWKRFSKTAGHILRQFSLIHSQDDRTTGYLHDLGLSHVQTGQNLKSVCGPLAYDAAELERMKKLLANRPVWLAGSTHPGEDEIMLGAHKSLLQTYPDLLLILVPRHPERAVKIEALTADHGLRGARRSTDGQINRQTQVYLADTIGETGLWYALCPITCLGGSFTPVGGHTPYEPAYAGSAIIHGSHYANFAQAYADLDACGGAVEVESGKQLENALHRWLSTPAEHAKAGTAAQTFALMHEDMLDELSLTLSKALSLR